MRKSLMAIHHKGRRTGSRIEEHVQHGGRAGYGEELIVRLSGDLHSRFGRGGLGRTNFFWMRSFPPAYRATTQTAPGEAARPNNAAL